jgi:hypothetical protein
MLEHPSIRWYSSLSHPGSRVPAWEVKIHPVRTISRKLPFLVLCSIPTGSLVCGRRGCFPAPVRRSFDDAQTGGRQLQPAFHIYQHQDHREVLEAMIPTFGCGRVRPNGPKEQWLDLRGRITSGPGDGDPAVLRELPSGCQACRLRSICRHRAVGAEGGGI